MSYNRIREEDIFMSAHAEERAWERGFTLNDIADLLSCPHVEYEGDPRYGAGRTVHAFDEVRIVTGLIGPDRCVDVITIMWRIHDSDAAPDLGRAA